MENERKPQDETTTVLLKYVLADLADTKEELLELEGGPVYETKEIGKVFEALAKAQGEMETAKNDSVNPFFKSKYADLASIIKASRAALTKHSLSVIQRILPGGPGTMYLHTRLGHPSGQWIESRVMIDPPKKDVQSLGSYITYLRRYAYAALVGVVAGDEDDDGEEAMGAQRVEAQRNAAPRSDKKPGKISKTQLQILGEEVKDEEDMVEYILETAQVGKLSDLPENKYAGVLKWVRDQKIKTAQKEDN